MCNYYFRYSSKACWLLFSHILNSAKNIELFVLVLQIVRSSYKILGSQHPYVTHVTKAQIYHNFLFPITIVEWNHLSNNLVHSITVETFKNQIGLISCAPLPSIKCQKWLFDEQLQIQIMPSS